MSQLLPALKAAFEFGFRCHEKGMNLQAALAKFDAQMSEPPKGQHFVMSSSVPNDKEQD
jgi:hypothetical protein